MAEVSGRWQKVKSAVAKSRPGSAIRALNSLRGPLGFEAVEPSHSGLEYRIPDRKNKPARRAFADVYLPESIGESVGSVVLVHGGGFTVGHRAMKPIRYLSTELVNAGIAVCAIDYRLLFRGGRLTEAVSDVEAAVDWWAAQSTRFGLDEKRIDLCGLSAGATLMLLSAPSTASIVRRFVSIFGLYDLSALTDPGGRAMARLVVGKGGPQRRRARSPIAAPPIQKPVFMLHGTDDTVVEIEQARAFATARQTKGLSTRLTEYAGEEHAFFNFPERENTQRAMRDILTYIRGGS